MIRESTVTRLDRITPNTPLEWRVFTLVRIGPEGASIEFPPADPQQQQPVLVLVKSAEAGVLEEIGRLLRLQLAEQEQARLMAVPTNGIDAAPTVTTGGPA